MDRQVEAELSAVRDFLAGRSKEKPVSPAVDSALRQQVVEELLSRMAGAGDDAKTSMDEAEVPSEQHHNSRREVQQRARALFMDHGYFDEAVRELRVADSPQRRAAAARALGAVGNKRGTPHLIAAMFDNDPEVRIAAEEALAQVSEPVVSDVSSMSSSIGARDSEKPNAADAALLVKSEESSVTENSPAHSQTSPASTHHEISSPTFSTQGVNEAAQTTGQEKGSQESKPTVRGLNRPSGGDINSPEPPAYPQVSKEPEQLLLEEQALRETVKKLERELLDAVTVRTELEKEAVRSVERETKLRVAAENQKREEEELRRRAEEEAERRRSQERESLRAEQMARAKAEAEVKRIADEEARMLLETANLRKAAEELVWQRISVEAARREAAEAVRHAEARRLRDTAEEQHNAELSRLASEERALRAATEETERRRAEIELAHQKAKAEIERLTSERVQLAAVETARLAEATSLRQEAKSRHEAEVAHLRNEEEALRALVEQVARRRAEVGGARQEAETEIQRLTKEQAHLAEQDAARRAETERVREALERNRADQEQLRRELEGLRLVAQELSSRRAELEVARKKSDEEAARLLEAQTRMRADEEARARAESERIQVEAELHQQVKTQQRLLDEARRRGAEEQQRIEDETRRYAELEQQRRWELDQLRKEAEMTAQQRAEEEKQIRSQVDSLRIADKEARKRIEEAESQRRKSEAVYRLVAEKVQRVEAEAHLRALEEEKILTRLEAARRSAAVEAQARAAQEKRIKEEIEHFRKLEEVDRPRLEVAALQRTQAQGLFQQQRDREKSDEVTRPSVDQLDAEDAQVLDSGAGAPGSNPVSEPEPPILDLDDTSGATTSSEPGPRTTRDEDRSSPNVTATIRSYLGSLDPYKRAAAVSELARSNAIDAFDLISKCFDDQAPPVRNAAARALLELEPARTVELFNRVIEEGSEQRRRNVGSAIAGSGVASEAIDNLVGEDREATYNALSILFVMAKTGEVQPLVKAIQEHPNRQIGEAALKLLTLSGKSEAANAALKRRANGVLKAGQ